VELASGEGRLSYAILRAFPNATLLALDGEDSMRVETARRLSVFGGRASVGEFDMRRSEWHGVMEGADAVVSSLCVHHLDGGEKRALFRAVRERLPARGALLIADIILPARAEARELFAATWDRAASSAALEQTGSTALFEQFNAVRWNLFRHPDDDFDKPSPLFDQLLWLKDAGFAVVDCFWLRAGHAIYGGYVANAAGSGLLFDAAWESAQAALAEP
jgi:tRNA (cmo5U34)-methyltransferase